MDRWRRSRRTRASWRSTAGSEGAAMTMTTTTAASTSMLAAQKVNQYYGGSHTLWDVDLDVPEGSRTCLMGRNGMGKTTLLKCIMGLLPATSGAIAFNGTDLRKLPAEGRARLGIGYVP